MDGLLDVGTWGVLDSMDRLYLDHNATTPQSETVTEAVMHAIQENWGNPSSIHQTGQRARAAVETARGEVAMLLGGVPEEVIFTSGGTESANTAITSALAMGEGKRVIVTSSVEHAAVRELVESRVPSGIEHVLLPPTDAGPVDPGALEEVLQARADEIAMVSVMWAMMMMIMMVV